MLFQSTKPYAYLLLLSSIQAVSSQAYGADLIGKVVSQNPHDVVSQISGVIEQTNWHLGDRLTKGTRLASIKSQDFKLALRKQLANVELVKADLKIKQSSYNRYLELRGKNSLSQHELDVAKANLEAAKANVALAEADLMKAQLDLGHTQIHAQINGYIASRKAENGAWVNQGELLYQLINIDRVNIRLLASEFDLNTLAIGQTIQIWSEASPTNKISANIKRISVKLDNEVLAYPVEIEIENPNHAFKPGMSIHATTHFQSAHSHAQ